MAAVILVLIGTVSVILGLGLFVNWDGWAERLATGAHAQISP
jgi:hypothetical protein